MASLCWEGSYNSDESGRGESEREGMEVGMSWKRRMRVEKDGCLRGNRIK